MNSKELWALFLLWWNKNGDLRGNNKMVEWTAYKAGFKQGTQITEKKMNTVIKEIQEALE